MGFLKLRAFLTLLAISAGGVLLAQNAASRFDNVSAQTLELPRQRNGVLIDTGISTPSVILAPEPLRADAPLATIAVTYIGFPTAAQAAFQRAVDILANQLTSSVPIRVNARWTPLPCDTDGCVLGSAEPTDYAMN